MHNCRNGQAGLINLLTVINLLTLAFHSVLVCLDDLWRKARLAPARSAQLLPLSAVGGRVSLVPDWTALLEMILNQRRLLGVPSRPVLA